MKSSMLIICAVFVIILGKAKEQGFPGIIYTDPFHPGMFVHVRQPALGDVREFSRSEDFATGEITVQWTDDRGRWSRRPDYRTNEDGALAEWIPEGRQERYGHRHLSHLHSAYEANGELGPDADLDLRAAAQEAVRRRIHSGGEPSSHGRAHMGLAAAELGLAQEAYGRIEIMATGRSMAPSLMCTHEPAARIYNVDANGALPEIMHRMLFRARLGFIELLPALPDAWPKGQISGVLAKGRITIVRLAWDAPARSVTCVLRRQIDQTVTVELPAYDSKGALTRSITLKTKENTPVTLTWQRSAQ